MTDPEDTAARLTLKIAGVFQDVRDLWVSRLDSYYEQLESLVDGQWFDANDLTGIIRESKMAAREALDGLGNDLSAELVHASRGLVVRYEYERSSLLEEINDLRSSLKDVLSGDENSIRRENQILRETILDIPEFQVLECLSQLKTTTYKELIKESGLSKSKVRKYVKFLHKERYVVINKKTRPHSIQFLHAPWMSDSSEIQTKLEISVDMANPSITQ